MVYCNKDYEQLLDEYYKTDMKKVLEDQKTRRIVRRNSFLVKYGKFVCVVYGLFSLLLFIAFIDGAFLSHEKIMYQLLWLLLLVVSGFYAVYCYNYNKAGSEREQSDTNIKK